MARHGVLGNGHTLALFDENGYLRDLYYPYAGLENHVVGKKHRIGMSVNKKFAWYSNLNPKPDQSSDTFSFNVNYDAFEEIESKIESTIYNEKNILIRKVTLTNTSSIDKEVKIFFNQEFKIKESKYRNTAHYMPDKNVVVHYLGRRAFLLNITCENKGIDDYTIGLFDYESKEGSYKNAEKIELSKNPVEHGPVDSVIASTVSIKAKSKQVLYYTMVIESSVKQALITNDSFSLKSPEHIFKTTTDYWSAWKNQRAFNFYNLSDNVVDLFYKSLFVIRSHSDSLTGGIIASGDTTHFEHGKDHYGYVWARDAYFPAKAMMMLGYLSTATKLFDFFSDVIAEEGYMPHKFEQDKALGSSWHPWINDGALELPIQEDETAAVVNLLYDYFLVTRDIEFVEKHFNNLVEKPANFMCMFINKKLNLPEPSYDLWEEKYIVTTYATCTVIRALKNASYLSARLGKDLYAKKYKDTALKLESSLMKNLYNKETKSFVKGLYTNDSGSLEYVDNTNDSSTLYGLWYYDILSPVNDKFKNTQNQIDKFLKYENFYYTRFENDSYFKDSDSKTPNPWIICTLWDIQKSLKYATSVSDLEKIPAQLEKIVNLATKSGILPEQIKLNDKSVHGYCPLVWSHATYVETIAMYLKQLEKFGLSRPCLPS
jgi:GH15 family glucan-1,4-alpha-glucosidase